MWNCVTTEPKSGSRIITTYDDGSGAKLFIVVEQPDGSLFLIDEDGDEHSADYLTNSGNFDSWAYLPEGAKLWCEVRSDEPIAISF